jgi:hypothetical protein
MGKVPSRLVAGVFVPLAVAALASCSQAAPRLVAVSFKLIYRQSGPSYVERLSCFAFAEDEDGDADLEELRIVNDRAQLYWQLTSQDWISVVKTGQTWFGSHTLSMPDGGKIPRGVYRIVLLDKGGERDERTMSFEAPLASERPFPSLSFIEGRFAVSSAYPKNLLVVYGASGTVLRSVELSAKSGAIADLSLGQTARSAALWAEDEAGSVAVLTDPVPLP